MQIRHFGFVRVEQSRQLRERLNYVHCSRNSVIYAVLWLRRLVAGLSPRRPGFDPGSVHVGFVVNKVALGQGFLWVLRFLPVNFIPPLLHYAEKWEKIMIFLIIFITELHNKPQGCGASVALLRGSSPQNNSVIWLSANTPGIWAFLTHLPTGQTSSQ